MQRIAKGLGILHDHTLPIAHGHLKAVCILVLNILTEIADFVSVEHYDKRQR